ncbi:arabinan endo-1,5-alpha-L-arabinosidase [bacterium A37T11]|nr:arabinan endo-1,5-alpha-L-arabinosidase [bacterium A37T11]
MILFSKKFLCVIFLVSCGKGGGDNPIKDTAEGSDEPVITGLTYKNPVFQPILADPSVIKAGDTFYAYGTQDDWGDGKGSRLVPVIKSKDLITWSVVGNAFATRPSWKTSGGIWAPDINYFNSKYYLYYALSTWGDTNPGIGVALSDKPEGPFQDQGKLFDTQSIGVPNSIDPTIFEDDGVRYLIWGSFSTASTQGIHGVQLVSDGLSIIPSSKFKIAAGDFEAPMIYKRRGYYYFFGSKGGCCDGAGSTYHVMVARSGSLKGPYLDKAGNDIAQNGNGTILIDGGNSFVGPGHNAHIVTDDKGTDWFLYHAISIANPKLANGTTLRALMLDKLTWENDWPVIKDKKPSSTLQSAPNFNNTTP